MLNVRFWRQKKMNILLLKSLTCMIHITQRQTPHVSMEAMQSTSRTATDEALPDTHLTVVYTAVGLLQPGVRLLFMLHVVTGGPATSHGLEIWWQVHGHATQWGWWYTLHYCSQDNNRASTDHGSLTRYMHGISPLTVRSKHFAPHGLRSWLRCPSSANYSYLFG